MENRTPFGPLVAVNEHTLKEGSSLCFAHTEPLNVLLIPIAGELDYRYSNLENTIDVGQAGYFQLPAGAPLEFSNHYTSSAIQFLQVCLRVDDAHSIPDCTCAFDLADDTSELATLAITSRERFSLGRLRGRQDVTLHKNLQHSGIFVYEISGTCEVQDRLLLPGDALSLMNVETIDFEALTPEAIVFVAELPFP